MEAGEGRGLFKRVASSVLNLQNVLISGYGGGA